MKKKTNLTNEIFLYSLILFLAVFVRLILLGRTPLTESEASWAYQAWQIWKGESISLGSLVSYLSITEGLFSIFGSSDFIARFWPALAGSLLIWVPYLSRNSIGRIPALVMALGLALDPALVSISRIAGSPVPALVFLLLAGLNFHHTRFSWSFVFLVLGAFSGPDFWFGAVVLGIVLVVISSLNYLDLSSYFRSRLQKLDLKINSSESSVFDFLIPIAFFIVVGSFFFTQPVGLGAWAAALPEYFQGWFQPSGVGIIKILGALAIFNPLILLFGILGFIIAWIKDDHIGKISTVWFVIALFLILIYPGRQTVNLIWVVIPLWISTARELVRLNNLYRSKWFTSSLSGLVAVLFILNWFTFTGMIFQGGNQRAFILQLGLITASLALVIVAMSIVASEWGWPAAIKSIAVGTAAVLGLYAIASMSHGAYLRAGDPRSLWTIGTGSGQMDLLMETVSEISITETGRWDSIEGAAFNNSPALLWTIRDMKNIQYFETYNPDILAPVIITREIDNYAVPEDLYRGQDFVLLTKPDWNKVFPDNWISYIAFREGPLQKEKIIIWVRNDILSGN